MQLIMLQVNSWSTLDNIIIGGFMAYLGYDPQVKALFMFWVGSDKIQQLIDMNEASLVRFMDVIITSCK